MSSGTGIDDKTMTPLEWLDGRLEYAANTGKTSVIDTVSVWYLARVRDELVRMTGELARAAEEIGRLRLLEKKCDCVDAHSPTCRKVL